jgi:hypothetical protein
VRHRLSILPLLLTAVVAFGVAPAGASADYKAIYSDCDDGTIDGNYTVKELQQALRNIEGNLGDYSECSDVIVGATQKAAAGKARAGGGSSTTGGGGSSTAGTSGSTGGSTPSTGTTGGGTTGGTTATPSVTGGPTQDAANTSAADDARNATATEQAAALAAAAAAESAAGKQAADLKDVAVSAAALELGGSSPALPLPLAVALAACVAAACIAGGTTGLQALRRRRGR